MTTLITVRNVNRTPLRLGSVNIPRDGSAVTIDIDNGRVRRDMYRHIGRWIIVSDNPDTSPPDPIVVDPLNSLDSAGAIADAAGDPPTDLEFNALVADHNLLQGDVATLVSRLSDIVDALVDRGIIELD